MERDEFLGRVQVRAHLGSRREADRITYATLKTLAEGLTADATKPVAVLLPSDIGRHLIKSGSAGNLTLEDFFRRVGTREGVDVHEAKRHAESVIEVLEEAVPEEALNRLRDQLSTELNQLFCSRHPEHRLWEQ